MVCYHSVSVVPRAQGRRCDQVLYHTNDALLYIPRTQNHVITMQTGHRRLHQDNIGGIAQERHYEKQLSSDQIGGSFHTRLDRERKRIVKSALGLVSLSIEMSALAPVVSYGISGVWPRDLCGRDSGRTAFYNNSASRPQAISARGMMLVSNNWYKTA